MNKLWQVYYEPNEDKYLRLSVYDGKRFIEGSFIVIWYTLSNKTNDYITYKKKLKNDFYPFPTSFYNVSFVIRFSYE